MRHGRMNAAQHYLALGLAALLLALGGVIAAPGRQRQSKSKTLTTRTTSRVRRPARRGRSLMQTQPDWLAFWCYKKSGHTKWSMRVAVDDGFGCQRVSPAIPHRTPVHVDQTAGTTPLCG